MAAPKRVSFHVGVGTYDPNSYPTALPLVSPPSDVRAMYGLAKSFGYTSVDLQPLAKWDGTSAAPANVRLDGAATYAEVVDFFTESAKLLQAGDRCFITFSCHGVQIEDLQVPSPDGLLDEGVCLFDFIMTDDVVTGLLRAFKKDVNVLLVLDCCHAGATSIAGGVVNHIKDFAIDLVSFFTRKRPPAYGIAKRAEKPASMPPPIALKLQEQFKDAKSLPMDANVVVFQACEDDQLTYDGKGAADLSVYTRKFVDAAGAGDLTIAAVLHAIATALPKIPNCTPDYRSNGDAAFLDTLLKT